jgi:hypothetical protein
MPSFVSECTFIVLERKSYDAEKGMQGQIGQPKIFAFVPLMHFPQMQWLEM